EVGMRQQPLGSHSMLHCAMLLSQILNREVEVHEPWIDWGTAHSIPDLGACLDENPSLHQQLAFYVQQFHLPSHPMFSGRILQEPGAARNH
ncbi:hypothetical protein, partial [Vibrio cidicii]